MSTSRPDGTLPDDVATYPFPLPHDTYRVSANVDRAGDGRPTEAGAWGADMLHVGADHTAVVRLRSEILDAEPRRFVAAPHARAASWDAMTWLLDRMARERPSEASLEHDGERYRWRNHRLGVTQEFVFGDDSSLPEHPLTFAGRQVEEDVVVLGARDDHLWLDAGMVVFASVWSIGFHCTEGGPRGRGPKTPSRIQFLLFRMEHLRNAAIRIGPVSRRDQYPIHWRLVSLRSMSLAAPLLPADLRRFISSNELVGAAAYICRGSARLAGRCRGCGQPPVR